MRFESPQLLGLLALVPLVLMVAIWTLRSRERGLAALASVGALAELVPRAARAARAWQAVLAVVAVAGMTVALARPQFGFSWIQRNAQGVSIVVVLDVSRSMDATDASPSRLEQARREVTDFLGLLKGDSVGLVLVANGAFLRLPLTTDYGTFAWALADSNTGTIQAQGTSMSGGLDTATQMLTRAEGAGKAIVVVSDGEFHDEASDLDAAVARAKAAGIRIYALGVGGSEGAPIPLPEGGFKKDGSGNLVMSRAAPDALRALASATGGAYVQSVPGDDDVRGLYVDEIRGNLEATERGVRREQVWNEQYPWFLGSALGAVVLSACLSIGRRGRQGAAGVAVVLCAFLLPFSAQASPREDGLAAMHEKNWPVAVDRLGQARVEDPSDVEVGQALGESLYRAGRYREAEQVFTALAQSDPAHGAIHQYNAGNAAYRDGRLEQALSHYQLAQKADAKLASAQTNATAVQKEIALREQQQQDQNQDGQANPQDGQQGQPQDGQQGQPQDGQQGQPQDGQQGQPQDGQQGEPQDGQQGQTAADKSGNPADPASAGGDQKDTGDPAGQAASASAPGDQPGDMTAAEAAKLVDGVKDGKPRVRISGPDTEKDW